jgi:hypothetical protein
MLRGTLRRMQRIAGLAKGVKQTKETE